MRGRHKYQLLFINNEFSAAVLQQFVIGWVRFGELSCAIAKNHRCAKVLVNTWYAQRRSMFTDSIPFTRCGFSTT